MSYSKDPEPYVYGAVLREEQRRGEIVLCVIFTGLFVGAGFIVSNANSDPQAAGPQQCTAATTAHTLNMPAPDFMKTR